MQPQILAITKSRHRFAGWAAIGSGIIGLIAYGCVMIAVETRTSFLMSKTVYLMFRIHDIGVILQFILLIPIVFVLHKFSAKLSSSMSHGTLSVGIAAISFTVLFLLLEFPKVLADELYMFPQGIFGVWLMVTSWGIKNKFLAGLKWLGIFVGFGLALVGTFPLGYAIFVDPTILHIPATEPTAYPDNLANRILHKILWIGSYIGVATLPVWSFLLGLTLVRESSTITKPN
jgi:hypothetical protein